MILNSGFTSNEAAYNFNFTSDTYCGGTWNTHYLYVDNFQDIEKINQILSKNSLQKKAKVAIRLSFDYENNKSRFGFDLEDVLELERKLLDNNKYEVLGFHLHLPFRDLVTY